MCLLCCPSELCMVGRRRGQGLSSQLRYLSQCLRYSRLLGSWSQEAQRTMGGEQRGLRVGKVELRSRGSSKLRPGIGKFQQEV